MTGQSETSLARAGRLAVALIGGYAFTTGLIALLGAGLPLLGMARSEAVTLGAMLAIPAYLGTIIWAVSSVRPVRSAIAICAAAVAMILTAPHLVQG